MDAKMPKIEVIAALAHETNRAYCMALGDFSQPSWLEAPEWQRNSALEGVKSVAKMLNKDGIALFAASHESWLAEKKAAGWHYGPVKNAEMKLHPCMVPFEALPYHQQFKGILFTTIVKLALCSATE